MIIKQTRIKGGSVSTIEYLGTYEIMVFNDNGTSKLWAITNMYRSALLAHNRAAKEVSNELLNS